MQCPGYKNNAIKYLHYANETMKEHELYEKFKEELDKCNIIDILKEYKEFVVMISKIMRKLVGESEEQEMRKKYIEYIETLPYERIEYCSIFRVSFEHSDRVVLKLSRSKRSFVIPEQIKIYCLCLGISVNAYYNYEDPNDSPFWRAF